MDEKTASRSDETGAAAKALCRCGRSRLHESAACSRDSVQLSARETWPRRNWIWSNSPPDAWHSFAHERLRSWGATWGSPSFLAYCFTTCQTTRSVTPSPQCLPARQTHRNSLPAEIPAAATHRSMVALTHSGTGTVRIWPPLPTRSTMAQCSSRCCKCIMKERPASED